MTSLSNVENIWIEVSVTCFAFTSIFVSQFMDCCNQQSTWRKRSHPDFPFFFEMLWWVDSNSGVWWEEWGIDFTTSVCPSWRSVGSSCFCSQSWMSCNNTQLRFELDVLVEVMDGMKDQNGMWLYGNEKTMEMNWRRLSIFVILSKLQEGLDFNVFDKKLFPEYCGVNLMRKVQWWC